MTFTTRYNVRDKVWLAHDGRIIEAAISKVVVVIAVPAVSSVFSMAPPTTSEVYFIDECAHGLNPWALFPTKKELLESLCKKELVKSL